MLRSALSKVAWVGRTASMVFGLALVMALVFGVASMAFGANGDFFKIGRNNVGNATSTLNKNGAGPALSLKVDSGPPLAVNSSNKVAKLNADQIDGKDSAGIGVNGLQRVEVSSAENFDSPKQVTATCPSGKVLVGTGFDVFGGKTGAAPNAQTDVVVDFVIPSSTSVTVAAYEHEGATTSQAWRVKAIAICATAGTP
jgi:hypothetical protein